MVFKDNFLRLIVTVQFQKNENFKIVIFLILFFSQQFIITWLLQKIYFLTTFSKQRVHISDHIAGVVGGPQYYQREYRYRKHCANNEVFIKDFFNKCYQIYSFLRIWSHLLKKSLLENLIFCAVEREGIFCPLQYLF